MEISPEALRLRPRMAELLEMRSHAEDLGMSRTEAERAVGRLVIGQAERNLYASLATLNAAAQGFTVAARRLLEALSYEGDHEVMREAGIAWDGE